LLEVTILYGIGKKVLATTFCRFEPSVRSVKNTNTFKQVALSEVLFPKFKSLVDIRKECVNRFYPEKDVFIKQA